MTKLTSKEFIDKLNSGDIKVGSGGKLSANESLFAEKEMAEIVTVEKKDLKENLEITSKLKEDVKNMTAIYIPGNVPSSKNNQQIIQIPVKNAYITPCCHVKMIKRESGGYFCPSCHKNTFFKTRPSIIAHKRVRLYKKNTFMLWKAQKEVFQFIIRNEKPPYVIGFYFIRDSARRYDYINAAQIVQDIIGTGIKNSSKMLISEPWIEDDDTSNIIPVFLGTHKNKDNAGVIIRPLPFAYKELLKELLLKS